MSKSLPLILRHAMYNLRGGFLIDPLTIALALGFAGAFFSWLEEGFPRASAWVPSVLFPSHSDPQVAQVILGGIATSIMTVVSIVFAILLHGRASGGALVPSPFRASGHRLRSYCTT